MKRQRSPLPSFSLKGEVFISVKDSHAQILSIGSHFKKSWLEYIKIAKRSGHWPGLPGNVISLYIVPLDPAYKVGLAGHCPAQLRRNESGPTLLSKIGGGDWCFGEP